MRILNTVFKALLALTILSISTFGYALKTEITYIHTDHLGSPILASQSDGTEKWKEDYKPFGDELSNQSTDSNVGFTGHLEDKSIGLTYMKGRWYHPEVGRFMALDPVGYTNANSIMSFNRYLYVNNNPYKYNDPNGEFLNFIIGGAKAAIENIVIQNLEIALGVRDEFSYSELALDTGLGTVTSGLSSAKNVAKLGALVKKLGSKGENVAKGGDKVKYHYTTADEASFSSGLWKDTSVTDKLYTNATEAGQKLGIPTPNKVITIKDNGNFVPNKPSIVEESNRFLGGGTDFVNPKRIPAEDILPAKPIN